MKFPIITLLAGILLLAASCNEDTQANLTISLVPLHNGQPLAADQVVQDGTGRKFSISDFRFYLTDLYLVKSNGDKVLLEDLALIEWPGPASDININIPKDTYSWIEFHVGLDPATNASDPDVFTADHPLSAAQNMHLGDLQYVFLEVKGKVDTSAAGNQNPSNELLYRLARNELYAPVRVIQYLDIVGTIIFFSLDFEISALFSGGAGSVDIGMNPVNTSTPVQMPDAMKVINNFVEALESN
jgi:hypothetical protein